MEIDKIVIKRNNSYWPHDNDSIDIFVGKIWIKIDIPYGHTSDEIFIDYSFGNGYEGLDQDKDNYEIEVWEGIPYVEIVKFAPLFSSL